MDSVLARRLTVVVVSVASLLICLALAWWQWERYESTSGTWQNLGYVLQWPLFGLFPAFAFWRMRRLRRQAQRAELQVESVADIDAEPARPLKAEQPTVTQPALEEADDELAAYNRYLAELHARDQQAR